MLVGTPIVSGLCLLGLALYPSVSEMLQQTHADKKGMCTNLYNPQGWQILFSPKSAPPIAFCQSPFEKPTVDMRYATPIISKRSFTQGIGYVSKWAMQLTFWKSIQSCMVWSFFGTTTTGLCHLLHG